MLCKSSNSVTAVYFPTDALPCMLVTVLVIVCAVRNLFAQVPAGAAPVWVRLLEQCTADPNSQPAVISSVALQLQQQQECGAQQGAQLEQHAVQLQEQEQQLAAARAEAAELRGQVQTLQTQLKEVLAALKQTRHD